MGKGSEVAIVGIGATEQGKIPGVSGNTIAVRAGLSALADAGIDKSQIDGLITCKPPRSGEHAGVDEDIGAMLGIAPRFASTLEYGACGFSLHLGAMAIQSGLAETVLLTYGTNQRTNRTNFGVGVGGNADWTAIPGLVHVAGPAAMAARRHMKLYGTTEEQIGWISVAQREWAQKNPLAIFHDPMTIDDYLAQPYQVAPLRRADLTMISDGGVAIVLTRAERVEEFRPKPIYLLALAQQAMLKGDMDPERLMRPWIKTMADSLWHKSGLGPSDMDVTYMQDATSIWVLQQLEWYGYCGVGEAGPFLAEGHTRPGGSTPVNTNGGQLSESYMWNWLHLYEAVQQLRGDAGDRQIAGASVALHAQTHDFFKGAATILGTERTA